MIFDLHGEPFDGRVGGRSFRDGPAFHYAVDLEAKIEMQV